MEPLAVDLFGGFSAAFGSTKLVFRTDKIRALLSYLLLEPNRAHRRETLATLLWGELPQTTALTNLRISLSRLNKTLAPWLAQADAVHLEQTHKSITLHLLSPDALALDVAAFDALISQSRAHQHPDALQCAECAERLTQAVALYRGELLAGFTLPDTPAFSEWLIVQCEQRHERLWNALVSLTRYHAHQRNFAAAQTCAARLIALDPLRDVGHRHIIELFLWQGDLTGAQAAYNEYVRLMREEWNAPPLFQMQDLERRADPARLSLHLPRHNLPAPLTSFVGREQEIAVVQENLTRTRLVTLTGVGGVGKTRLALELAHNLLNQFADGVYWVDLSLLRDTEAVLPALARVLGLGETPLPPEVSLKNYLRDQEMLLVLDNFEQVLDAAPRVSELLKNAPRVKMLVTSRSVLDLQGETEYRVSPLETPPAPTIAPEQLNQFPATRLYLERAQFSAPHFVLNAANAETVQQICQRLDGLPLAIEIVAARTRHFTPQEILVRLEHRLPFLVSPQRDLPDRQRTMRATMAWSYNLLNDAEKNVLRELAVFVGGWTVASAQAVCTKQDAVLPLLASLADKSLLTLSLQDDETRYGMLDTIHEFVMQVEHTKGQSGVAQVKDTHLDFFMGLAETAEPHLRSAEKSAWFKRLESEHDNLRAASEWAIETKQWEQGLRLSVALLVFCIERGYFSEWHKRLQTLLAQSDATAVTALRAQAIYSLGYLSEWKGDFESAQRLLSAGLAMSETLGDKKLIATIHLALGEAAGLGGERELARKHLELGLPLFRERNDLWAIGVTLHHLGKISLDDHAQARAYLQQALAVGQQIGDRLLIAGSLLALGKIADEHHDYTAACSFFERAVETADEVENKSIYAALRVELANVKTMLGDYDTAGRLYHESLAFARKNNFWIFLYISSRMGWFLLYQEQLAEAENFFRASLSEYVQSQNPATLYGVLVALDGTAELAVRRKNFERGLVLSGFTEKMAPVAHLAIVEGSHHSQDEHAHLCSLLRDQYDDAAYDAGIAQGKAMTLDQAIEYALAL